jgi:hypothetical protein
MNTAFDNFIKGPLTSLLGFALMILSGYGWYTKVLTDAQAICCIIAGFALLFMKDKLPDFIGQFFKAIIEKLFGNKNTPQQ